MLECLANPNTSSTGLLLGVKGCGASVWANRVVWLSLSNKSPKTTLFIIYGTVRIDGRVFQSYELVLFLSLHIVTLCWRRRKHAQVLIYNTEIHIYRRPSTPPQLCTKWLSVQLSLLVDSCVLVIKILQRVDLLSLLICYAADICVWGITLH